MKQLIVSMVLTIIMMGITFWAMNNPNGIGAGLNQGAMNVKEKIIEATN
jgi:hypothetical protein